MYSLDDFGIIGNSRPSLPTTYSFILFILLPPLVTNHPIVFKIENKKTAYNINI